MMCVCLFLIPTVAVLLFFLYGRYCCVLQWFMLLRPYISTRHKYPNKHHILIIPWPSQSLALSHSNANLPVVIRLNLLYIQIIRSPLNHHWIPFDPIKSPTSEDQRAYLWKGPGHSPQWSQWSTWIYTDLDRGDSDWYMVVLLPKF